MDLIDREQALKLLNLNRPNVDEKTKYAMWQFDKDFYTIKTMPSTEKTGRWIESTESRLRPFMCSNCGCIYDVDTSMGKPMWNYCPNCGARMVDDEH